MSYANQAAAASAAYRTSQQLDQRPAAVLAAVHQELASVVNSAIAAYRRRALDEMCRHNARAVHLLWGLMAALDGHSPETGRLVEGYARLRDAINRVFVDSNEINTLEAGVEWLRQLTRNFLNELRAA